MYILGCILVFVVICINFNNPVTKDRFLLKVESIARETFTSVPQDKLKEICQISIIICFVTLILSSWITIGLLGIQFIYKKFIQ